MQLRFLTTRFLYPFFLSPQAPAIWTAQQPGSKFPATDQDRRNQAMQDLQCLLFQDRTVWQVEKVKELYHQEMLAPTQRFIFGNNELQHCRVNPTLISQWFGHGLQVEFGKTKEGIAKESFWVNIDSQIGIELFLLPQGIGVLSIALILPIDTQSKISSGLLNLDNQAIAECKRFNYRLSQFLENKRPQLYLPLSSYPSAPPAPDLEAPIEERLGKRGGRFTMLELRDFVLSPFSNSGHWQRQSALQEQFLVYTVLQFDEIELGDSQMQEKMLPLLVGLGHVEEPNHAGSLQIQNQVLNNRHWAAVGSLGAVHFIADQGQEIAFNSQRLPIVANKYFLPYLLALSQRLTFQQILQQTQQGWQQNENVGNLHEHMLNFMLHGYFTEISSREVINQYYTLARTGSRVEESFTVVRQALHDVDQWRFAADQRQSTQQNGAHLQQLVTMQRKIEWLEVFFASYYAGALAHYIGYGWFQQEFTSVSTLVWALFAGFFVYWGLQPLKHQQDKQSRTAYTLTLLVVFSLISIAWVFIGFAYYPSLGSGAHP